MKRYVTALLLCCLCCGCAINAPYYRPSEGADSKDGLIMVEYFDMTHAKNSYKGKSDFSRIITEYVAGALQERGFQAVTVERQNAQVSGKYRITGEITKFDQGNFQGRFWVGLGLGMARISTQVVLTRVSDNTEIIRVKDTVSSCVLRSTESILRRVCASLSRNIVDKLYGALRNDTK